MVASRLVVELTRQAFKGRMRRRRKRKAKGGGGRGAAKSRVRVGVCCVGWTDRLRFRGACGRSDSRRGPRSTERGWGEGHSRVSTPPPSRSEPGEANATGKKHCEGESKGERSRGGEGQVRAEEANRRRQRVPTGARTVRVRRRERAAKREAIVPVGR